MPKTERRAEAFWVEARSRWQINVQKEGERKTFTSSIPGRKGKHEAEFKAEEWLNDGTEDKQFSAAWESYLESYKASTSASAHIKYKSMGKNWITPNIKKNTLSSITPNDWQKCIDAAAKAGRSHKVCENIRGEITSFCKYARKNRWKLDMPMPGELAIPKDAPRKKKRILQPNALKLVFSQDTISHYKKDIKCHFIHAWRFLIVTGMRRGELVALRNEDVDEKNRVAYMRQSINNLCEMTDGKNENAERYVALSDIALSELKEQRAMLKRAGIISPYVFPDKDGNLADPNKFYKRWYAYRNQHEVPCSLHELRHTFISVVKSDMPEALLKQQVGHSADTDSIGIYGHYVEGDVLITAQIIDRVFSRLLGT